MKVLIVEDDESILELLRAYCDSKGYEPVTASDGRSALELFRVEQPDLVLLDIMLPQLDGWSVIEALRDASEVPVLFLTSLRNSDDVVRGLALGADDYVPKPFEMKELDARIDAVMRRVGPQARDAVLSAGRVRIDDRLKRVSVDGREVSLTPKELELLKLLASDAGRVFSAEEILARLWRDSPRASSADVKQYIHLLRRKLDESGDLELIRTVKGFGYQLVA